jgi:hypothetical protein
MKKFLISALCISAAAIAQTAPVKPETFAHRSRIDLGGATPHHQLALPLAVYQGAMRGDLGDLRVFNGKGEVVPHSLLRSKASSMSQVKETPVSLFPIIGSKEGAGEMSVEVRRNGDDTLVAVRQSAAAKTGTVVRGLIIDISKIQKSGLRSLRLEMSATNTPFHPFTLETSDDLQQWRLLQRNAQLVHLEHGGQRIDQDSMTLDAETGKYLRILWTAPEQAPAITAARVSTIHSTSVAPMLWSNPIAPLQSRENTYEYSLPGSMPLEQVRINLPQANTLVPIEIQQFNEDTSRHRRAGSWGAIKQSVVYRLQSPQGDVTSPDIVLNWPALQRLRLAVDTRSGGLGNAPPTLQVGFVPHVLVFLARGEGPFDLAWGAASLPDVALPAETLIPGYRDDQKLAASPATLQATAVQAAASTAADSEKPASKGVLWAVLIAGVLVLGGMASVLLKQLKSKDGPAA